MGLAETIINDMKAAMKNGDKIALEVVRMLKSDFKYKEIELKRELKEDDYIAVVSSSVKKRRDAIEEYGKGGREDLVAREKAELDVLVKYLPQQLSEQELDQIVDEAVAESGASTPAEIGMVMKIVMPRVKGRADGRMVNELVLRKLNK